MRTFRSAIILLVACGLPQYLRGEVHRRGIPIETKTVREAIKASHTPTKSRLVAITGPSKVLPVQAMQAVAVPTGRNVSPGVSKAGNRELKEYLSECKDDSETIESGELRPMNSPAEKPAHQRVRTVHRGRSPLPAPVPGVFVHQAQHVRMSERTAEIRIVVPEHATVSINDVEYPHCGRVRIFHTRLSTHEPQMFAIQAWTCEGHTCRTPLHLKSSSDEGVVMDENCTCEVTLMPGLQLQLEFDQCKHTEGMVIESPACPATPANPSCPILPAPCPPVILCSPDDSNCKTCERSDLAPAKNNAPEKRVDPQPHPAVEPQQQPVEPQPQVPPPPIPAAPLEKAEVPNPPRIN